MLAQSTATGGLSTEAIVAIVIVALIVIALVAVVAMRRRSQRLRERFGPEYEREVARTGSPTRAEQELEARERRYKKLDIRPLTPGAKQRYAEEWRSIQARFVDDPSAAVAEAERVLEQVMRDRGYPLDSDPARRVEDLSVEHAAVIDNYRVASDIARRNERREASTEELRRATVSYRTLFEDLLGDDDRRPAESRGATR
jgi:hypothetical protein